MATASLFAGRIEQRAGLLLSAATISSLFIISLLRGTLGLIGPDGDDVMRLVQVRDLLAGQGWYDLVQPRLGPDGGTLMHWSRLVDLPIAALATLFGLFLPQDAALAAAITLWPPLSVLIVIAGLMLAARAFSGRGVVLFMAIIAFGVLFRHFRFLPGAIDHHNLQLGLLILATGCIALPSRAPRAMAVAGALLAAAVAIGAEVYPFAALTAAFVALDWAISGAAARRGAIAFGLALAAMLAVLLVATVPPSDYGAVRCDALSPVHVLAGLCGGAGLALAAGVASARTMTLRFACLGATGLVCLLTVLAYAPDCLGNPLDALSPAAQALWLARVDEARPLFALARGEFNEVLFRLGTLVVGLGAAFLLAFRPDTRRAGLLFALLLAVSIGLTLHQTRFYVFGQLFAIVPMAALTARLWTRDMMPSLPRPAYLFALLLAFPMMWNAAGLLLAPPQVTPAARLAAAAACDAPAAQAAFAGLPPGRILAPATDAPGLLRATPHSVLYGHYHRNTAGIDAALAIFTAPPEAARSLLADAGVAYLLVCPADADMRFFARHAPDGLIGKILAGHAPPWLETAATAGPSTIYRVAPPG